MIEKPAAGFSCWLNGGVGGIRTHGAGKGTTDFESYERLVKTGFQR